MIAASRPGRSTRRARGRAVRPRGRPAPACRARLEPSSGRARGLLPGRGMSLDPGAERAPRAPGRAAPAPAAPAPRAGAALLVALGWDRGLGGGHAGVRRRRAAARRRIRYAARADRDHGAPATTPVTTAADPATATAAGLAKRTASRSPGSGTWCSPRATAPRRTRAATRWRPWSRRCAAPTSPSGISRRRSRNCPRRKCGGSPNCFAFQAPPSYAKLHERPPASTS